MNTIGQLLSDLWSATITGFEKIYSGIVNLNAFVSWSFYILGSLMVFSVVYLFDAVQLIYGLVNNLSTGALQAQIASSPALGSLASGFAIANALLPLTEAIGLAAALMSLYIIASTIRLIKAWIPTMN
jgi:hypothetical protein